MKATAQSKIITYNLEINSEELSELNRIVKAFFGYTGDEKAAAFNKEFEKILRSATPTEEVIKDEEGLFFYETYNFRAEKENGTIDYPKAFTGQENLRFMLGKDNQIGIQYWENWEAGKRHNREIWFNKYCAILIAMFIKERGTGLYFGLAAKKNSKDVLCLELYLDHKGNKSNEKQMTLYYDITTNSVAIRKEGASIGLNLFQSIKLKQFIEYHLS
jgi:hypothetical protein